MTMLPESCLTEPGTQVERKYLGVIRREATDGVHVRVKIIAHNEGDLVLWRLVSMAVNQYERHDVCAGKAHQH